MPLHIRRSALLLAAVLAAALTACQSNHQDGDTPAGSTTPANSGGQTSSSWVGDYSGSTPSVTISFSASSSGIRNLAGEATVTCTQSSNNVGLNQSDPFQIPGGAALAADGSFSADSTTNLPSGGTAELTVHGKLDHAGHASGTFRYNIANECDTGTEQWTASLGGASTTPAPSNTPAAAGCSPAPCGTSGGVTLYVDKLGISHGSASSTIVVFFHLSNQGTAKQEFSGSLDVYQIMSGSVTSAPSDNTNHGEFSDGTICNTADATLPPDGTSGSLNVCIPVAPSGDAEPLTFVWNANANTGELGGKIDISSLPLTPMS